MGKPYSEDLRERVIGAAQDGATIPEIAEQFGVSISSVVRFRRLHRETGSVSPAKFGGYKGYALAAHEELVRELVAEQSDITLAELRAVLATENVTVGQSSISRFLHHLNLRFKKSLRAAEQDRPDVAAARKALQKRQPRLDPKRLVFIDGVLQRRMERRKKRLTSYSCAKDEGGPLGIGFQEQVSNQSELLR